MKSSELIQHPSELNALTRFPFAPRRTRGKLRLAETFGGDKRQLLEKQLNRHYFACGCSEGAKGLILGFLLGVVVACYLGLSADWQGYRLSYPLLAGTLLGAVAGKIIGLLRANTRLQRTVREIQGAWKGSWPKGEPIGCG